RRKAPFLGKRAAGDVLHDDERPSVRVARVVHTHDVRMRQPSCESRLAGEAGAKVLVVGQAVRKQLDRDRAAELLVVRQIDGRHPAVTELALDPVAAGSERLAQSFSSPFCLCWPLCLPWSCRGATWGGGTHWTRVTSALTALDSCSCKPAATCPSLIAANVCCWSWRASVSARHGSFAASADATASLCTASADPSEWERAGGGGADSFTPPHALRQSAAAPRTAPSCSRLVVSLLFTTFQTRSERARQPALEHLVLGPLDRICNAVERGKPPLEIEEEPCRARIAVARLPDRAWVQEPAIGQHHFGPGRRQAAGDCCAVGRERQCDVAVSDEHDRRLRQFERRVRGIFAEHVLPHRIACTGVEKLDAVAHGQRPQLGEERARLVGQHLRRPDRCCGGLV